MASRDDVASAIEADRARAQEALVALQAGAAQPVTLDSLEPVAEELGLSLAQMAAFYLEQRGLLQAYAVALEGRGVPVGAAAPAPVDELATPEEQRIRDIGAFEPVGKAAACRIVLGEPGRITGSGCLVGPSLVLTAWHVIASGAPGTPDAVREPVSVLLADGTRRSVGKVIHYLSECTPEEYGNGLPANDAAFANLHDVALLQLTRADGMRLNFIRIPDAPPPLRSGAGIFVLDFPEGRNEGWGIGRVQRIPRIRARVRHDAPGNGGSSGAACVNTRFQLVGLHQGRWPPARRLVPLDRFHQPVSDAAAADLAPDFLWSLTGDLDGQLVFGRDLFFEGVAEAARAGGRVRGLRVKRLDPSRGTAGLAFSAELLKRVLGRNPTVHRFIRIAFDQPFQDLLEEIRARAAERGLDVPAEPPRPGARPGETTTEAALGDRARRLAQALDAKVLESGEAHLLWFFFENPVAGLKDVERFAFEGFVGAALRQPRLRLVLAGFETITSPGEEFADAGQGRGPGPAGLVVEHIGRFSARDVEVLVERAGKAMRLDLAPAVVKAIAGAALLGRTVQYGFYDAADSEPVAAVVAQRLAEQRQLQGGGG